jgi:hypothetical protein
MNQEKSNETYNLLHTQNNMNARFIYNTGTLNFSRFIDTNLTQPEEVGSEEFLSIGDETPAKDNATSNNKDSVTDNALDTNGDETMHGGTVANENPTNDAAAKNASKPSDFITANGTQITPRTPKLSSRTSSTKRSTIITPQPNTNITKQPHATDSTANGSIPSLLNPHVPKLKSPEIYDSVLLDKRYKPKIQ